MKDKLQMGAVLRTAGAFVAWVVGSGFATGQEILQFFTSFGLNSYFTAALVLVEFAVFGILLVDLGYEHRAVEGYDHFTHICGKKVGIFYALSVPLTLPLIMSVLLSGAGATLLESFGIPKAVGSAVMALFVLFAFLIGFEKFVRVVSFVGPVIILFSLAVGSVTTVRDFSLFSTVKDATEALAQKQTSPHFLVSGLLYLTGNYLGGSAYFAKLGRGAPSKREARLGALIGAVALVSVILLMNTALLLHGTETAAVDIPTLYLAGLISPVLKPIFTFILLLGIFSSCSAMLWTVSDKVRDLCPKEYRALTVLVLLLSFGLSLFSFGKLMSVLYPAMGYFGIPFFVIFAFRTVRHKGKIPEIR